MSATKPPPAKREVSLAELTQAVARLLAFVVRSSQPGHTGMLNAMERREAEFHIARLTAGDTAAIAEAVSFVDYLVASLGDPVAKVLE